MRKKTTIATTKEMRRITKKNQNNNAFQINFDKWK